MKHYQLNRKIQDNVYGKTGNKATWQYENIIWDANIGQKIRYEYIMRH